MKKRKLLAQLSGSTLIAIVAGCATIAEDPKDPWEGWNRGVQLFNDNLGPVSP
ncbi:MAG: hypothetical protein PHY16_01665 [Methylobacter sp.]|nr:hypothetical protein [Methylobacter sp.]